MNNLLIVSRARYVKIDDGYNFQVNDGHYINNISKLFDEVFIIAGQVSNNEVFNEKLPLRNNIICINRNKLSISSWISFLKLTMHCRVVYLFYPLKLSLLIAIFAKIIGKPIIAYNGGAWSEIKSAGLKHGFSRKLNQIIFDKMEFLSIKLSDFYLVNNSSLYEKYKQSFTIEKTIPLIRITKENLYRRTDTCTGKAINILSVNHIKKGKKILELIQGFNLLLQNQIDVSFRLTIIGQYYKTDSSWIEIADYITKNNLNNYVRFTGIINDVDSLIKYYRSSDLLVLVTESEGFPRVIWEAFSQSLPVLCSSLPNIVKEFDESKMPIYLLKNDEPETIMNSIQTIFENQKIRKNLIENENYYFHKKMEKTPVEQFESILKNKLNTKLKCNGKN